jgi:UDP-N-acetylglucosamine 2-epimerase (non-hydrolysing)
MHPRTRKKLAEFHLSIDDPKVKVVDPMSYLQFLALQRGADVVITDSGGIQEETTFLGVPCLTVRENTERPVTVTTGTNVLVGRDMKRLRHELQRIVAGTTRQSELPPLWDGHAGERIARILITAC